MIGIINYGLGNLGSIKNMFRYLDIDTKIINEPSELNDTDKLVLPGVGSFDAGMKQLKSLGWIEPLSEAVLQNGVPILGICLGMQLMTDGSEEGNLQGLGWIKGVCKKFEFEEQSNIKIPHMGWTEALSTKDSKLIMNDEDIRRFYFVHSYYVELENRNDELFKSNYGFDFTSGFENKNIVGVQFHPEKSHRYGKTFLENFNKF